MPNFVLEIVAMRTTIGDTYWSLFDRYLILPVTQLVIVN